MQLEVYRRTARERKAAWRAGMEARRQRAWVLAPDVLLLDEPTASMDPDARREVEALLGEFASGQPQTLVFSSHTIGLVSRLASRVICLQDGRIRADLPVQEFLRGAVPGEARLSLGEN